MALRHIYRDERLFIKGTLIPTNIVLEYANGKKMIIYQKGDLRLTWEDNDSNLNIIRIVDAFYISKAFENLLLLGQLGQKGIEVQIMSNSNMRLFKGNAIYMRGFWYKNLFYLKQFNFAARVFIFKQLAIRAFTKSRNERLHARLGYSGKTHFKRIKNMVFSIETKKLGDYFCKACIFAKATRAPGKEFLAVEVELLGCIHMDLCGPFVWLSIERKKYMLILTN